MFVQVYFTSEEVFGLMRDLRYFDLRGPWLDSPG